MHNSFQSTLTSKASFVNYDLTGWAEGGLGRGGDLFVVTEHK